MPERPAHLPEWLPPVGLGTWELRGARCRRVVEQALQLGYRHVDTAQGYDNEAEVGRALEASGRRDDVLLATKTWPDDLVRDPDCIRRSLERLRVEAVDLVLLHWPSPDLPLERTVDALSAELAAGRARRIGVSNFPVALLERACARAPIACNQVERHPFLVQPTLLAAARRLGVPLVAYAPLARGAVAREPRLLEMARTYGATPAQVALAWQLARGVAVVAKASSGRHLAENLGAADLALAPADLARLDELHRGLRLYEFDFAPKWDVP